jgi:hypothetical protein
MTTIPGDVNLEVSITKPRKHLMENGISGSVRFEVFTAVTLKNAVFWDAAPCGSCKNRRFGGTYRFHHQDNKN